MIILDIISVLHRLVKIQYNPFFQTVLLKREKEEVMHQQQRYCSFFKTDKLTPHNWGAIMAKF